MTESRKTNFSRRSFIKGAAVLTAAGALAGCSPQTENLSETGPDAAAPQEVPETQIYSGVCRGNCAGGCFLNVHVRDGKVVRTTARDMPDTAYNRICSKGVTHVGRIYSAERLQYPMRRVGERGQGEFERISWDEALDEIVEKWTGYIEEYGPRSVGLQMGSGQYAIAGGTGMGSAASRFYNVMGFTWGTNNSDAAAGYLSGFSMGSTFFMQQNEMADMLNSKTIVCWGANPVISQTQSMHFILEAKDLGAKYVVIDPVYNANSSKADMFVPINASTDGVLGFGVLRELFDRDWIEKDFVRDHTEASILIKDDERILRMSDLGVEPTVTKDEKTGQDVTVDPYAVWDESANALVPIEEAVRPAIEGVTEANGISVRTAYDLIKERVHAYSAEQVEEITGVPSETVSELARIYHEDGPVNTWCCWGADHYINGHYNYWSICLISLFTGNVGKPGAAFGLGETLPSNCNVAGASTPTDKDGNPCQGGAPRYFTASVLETILGQSQADEEIVPMKSMLIVDGNPASTFTGHSYVDQWLKAVDFLVVSDMSMTETAKYADILLPACHWFEQVDIFGTNAMHPYLLWQEQATEPLYESKPDYWIYTQLAQRMGYGEFFPENVEDFLAIWLDSDAYKEMGITLDSMKRDKAARFVPTDVHIAFPDGVFLTPSGRARLYKEEVVPAYNFGQSIDESKEKSLYWEPAREADINSEIRQKYPYHLLSEHMKTRTHSQWWDVGYLHEYEPEPLLRVNPEDAEELGLVEGDVVNVYNDHGYVHLPVVINCGLPRGMVSTPRSWQASEFIEGHLGSLSQHVYNQVLANQAYNDVAVAIEKL